jgi:hypothetical protein
MQIQVATMPWVDQITGVTITSGHVIKSRPLTYQLQLQHNSSIFQQKIRSYFSEDFHFFELDANHWFHLHANTSKVPMVLLFHSPLFQLHYHPMCLLAISLFAIADSIANIFTTIQLAAPSHSRALHLHVWLELANIYLRDALVDSLA